jgi:hypothetical protein
MASALLPPAPEPEKGWRRRLAVPSLLAPTLDVRIREVERGTFSQHAIETVCFDLRIRRAHAVTGQFARETPRIQDAIDRFIVAFDERWKELGFRSISEYVISVMRYEFTIRLRE